MNIVMQVDAEEEEEEEQWDEDGACWKWPQVNQSPSPELPKLWLLFRTALPGQREARDGRCWKTEALMLVSGREEGAEWLDAISLKNSLLERPLFVV